MRLKDDEEKLEQWMVEHGFATGHGDTIEDLLKELERQINVDAVSMTPDRVDKTDKFNHITVVCHKDHDKGYEDYVGKCLLCEVERLQNRDWVGLTPTEFNSIKDTATTIGYAITKTEAMLKEKNAKNFY